MFAKDILIVDFEVTGFNLDNDDPVQIGFVLLDKNTLQEKQSFVSWIKSEKELHQDLQGFRWSNITEGEIRLIIQAPPLQVVAKRVIDNLPPLTDITFASWNVVFDFVFWKKLLKIIDIVPKTAHLLDLWTIAYLFLIKVGDYKGDFSSKSTFKYFGFPKRERHDALEDTRLEAEVLRRIIKNR